MEESKCREDRIKVYKSTKAFIPSTAISGKAQAIDKLAESTATETVCFAALQRNHSIIDKNPNQLFIVSIAPHLLDIRPGAERCGPARAKAVCVEGALHRVVSQGFSRIE